MVITKNVIDALHSNYLTADEFIFLYNEYYKCGWDWVISPGSLLKLKKTGFVEENGLVSVIGESILLSLNTVTEPVIEVNEDQFEDFWKEFPRDDSFRTFPKTRVLRFNKIETRRLYNMIRQEYSHEDLMKALKTEISERSKGGVKNLFTYMKGSINWLKDKSFLDYLNCEVVEEENTFFGKNIKM